MKKSPSRRFIVKKEASLLEAVASEIYPSLSRREVKRGIEGKGCLVGSKLETYASKIVRTGAPIEVFEAPFLQDAPKLNRVVYEDDHFLVYDKPVGFVCEEPLQVHRLDKETSGIYMVAKNEKMHAGMCELFRKRLVRKRYVALIARTPKERGGRIETKLRVKKKLNGQKIWGSDTHGLNSRTDWKLVESCGEFSKVALNPTTGRTHQIRVHMSEMGHPILGDYQYGKAFPFHVLRHMLHAESVTFTHPITGKTLTLHSEAPF